MFSNYLASRHDLCKSLVERLLNKYEYVSLLGKHTTGRSMRVTSVMNSVGDTMEKQCGFVVKIYNGKTYSEYSFSDIDESNIDELETKIIESVNIDESLASNHVHYGPMKDEPLKEDFRREMDDKYLSTEEIMNQLAEMKNKVHSLSENVIQAVIGYTEQDISSMFISRNKDLTQNYFWANGFAMVVVKRDNNIQDNMAATGYNSIEKSLLELNNKLEETVKVAVNLLDAEMIEPGVYDIITNPGATGLIVHEAFGHGVEMDMYVKERALSKKYIGKRVASDLVEMHDGAAGKGFSVASYFFDDDGVLAHDTLIIKKGILQTGISDSLSALQLGLEGTGNGRRESYKRKAYTRMTNTYFMPGNDKLEDMIKSIKHGYMVFNTSNGMEDPKNWNIQCVCQYGMEIKDGKFTGKYVAPVCLTGYVPELLESISMVSSDFELEGFGHCGKGYKEWTCVSDGGPYLKARCKLS